MTNIKAILTTRLNEVQTEYNRHLSRTPHDITKTCGACCEFEGRLMELRELQKQISKKD